MELLKTILLPLDFGVSMENTVSTAMEIGKVFQSNITLIHVLPNDIESDKVKNLLHEAANKKLAEVRAKIEHEGLQTGAPIIEYGSPHERITQVASSTNANLILIGSGEHAKEDGFQLGTTSSRIIQKSEKPVLVVKEGTPLNVQNILCPVDFSVTSKRALKNAIAMAHKFKAELTILSVCEPQGSSWLKPGSGREAESEKRMEQLKVKLDDFLKGLNLAGLQWTKEVRKGNPAEEILNLISGRMTDLLVMGTQGKTGLNRLIMGSVTEKVIRAVPCSFLTLKSEDVISLRLESSIRTINNHYDTATELVDGGFFEEAIGQLKTCIHLNMMYLPAYFGIAKIYDKMNEPEKAERYRQQGREAMDQMWYAKIEEEVRRLRSS